MGKRARILGARGLAQEGAELVAGEADLAAVGFDGAELLGGDALERAIGGDEFFGGEALRKSATWCGGR